ncbi:Ankyrin repeat-containing domain protein [Hyaloscypha variabilis]
MLNSCTRKLGNLVGIRVTVSPSADAYETIVSLKLLIAALQKLSDRGQYNRAGHKGKRKAETEDECEKSGSAKRMKVEFELISWHRIACKRARSPLHVCGRAAEHYDEYFTDARDRYPREPFAIHRKNRDSMALHRAAENGLEVVVQLLLEEGADIEAKDCYTWTALHRAAANGCVSVVRLLLEHGADIAAKTATGSTVLHQAACNGWEAVTQLLLEKGADIGVRPDKEIAIREKAEYRQGGVVKMLIEHWANIPYYLGHTTMVL